MKRVEWMFLVLCLVLARLALAGEPSTETTSSVSVRGAEVEAQRLHQQIADAKANGQGINPAWIARLNELEPLAPSASVVSPQFPDSASLPRIEHPDSPLEQQIRALEAQLPAPSSGDMHWEINADIKAQLNDLYAQRPENQRLSLDQGGDNCASVNVISSLPFLEGGTTAGYANDFTSCGSGAPDVIYQLTAPTTGSYVFNLCTFNFYDSRLEVRSGGPCPGMSQLACNDDYCGLQSYLTLDLTAGETYYVIVDGFGSSAGQYGLFIYANYLTCPENCQNTNVTECPESEGLVNFGRYDCDGGCGLNTWGQPVAYQDIALNQVICGRYFAYEDSTHNGYWRDADWYRFTISSPSKVLAWARGQIYTYVDLRSPDCNADPLATAGAGGCSPAIAQAFLNPGTYAAEVFPDFSFSMPPLNYTTAVVAIPQSCATSGLIVAPGSYTGNTCTSGNYCTLRPSYDMTVPVLIPHYGNWRFSLCNSSVAWDSYIYLASTCCGTPIALSDDYCGLLSQVDACLSQGLYYLIVEGYSEAYCNSFTLNVTEQPNGTCCYGDVSNPQCQDGMSACVCAGIGGTWMQGQSCATVVCGPRPPCQDDADYGQAPSLPTESWNAYFSDEALSPGERQYERFTGLTYPVTSVRFWGTGADAGVNPCTEPSQVFRISFHNDSSGHPNYPQANPVCQYRLPLTGTYIGNYPVGATSYPMYQYDAVLPATCNMSTGWISVIGALNGGDPSCYFAWLTSPYGDHLGSADMAFCVAGQPTCANPLAVPQNVTCNSILVGSQRHIQLTWHAFNAGVYEIWSTTHPNNDGNPDGGLDSLWHREARVVVEFNFGTNQWTDPNPITALYKNYVMIQTCRPPNDDCEAAIPIANGFTNYSNLGADTDGPPATCGYLGSDVWFSYTARCSGNVIVNTCTGTNYDTAIEVFAGTCSNLGAPWACSDDYCSLYSYVAFAATIGNTYLIRVGGFSAEQGSGTLNVLSPSCP